MVHVDRFKTRVIDLTQIPFEGAIRQRYIEIFLLLTAACHEEDPLLTFVDRPSPPRSSLVGSINLLDPLPPKYMGLGGRHGNVWDVVSGKTRAPPDPVQWPTGRLSQRQPEPPTPLLYQVSTGYHRYHGNANSAPVPVCHVLNQPLWWLRGANLSWFVLICPPEPGKWSLVSGSFAPVLSCQALVCRHRSVVAPRGGRLQNLPPPEGCTKSAFNLSVLQSPMVSRMTTQWPGMTTEWPDAALLQNLHRFCQNSKVPHRELLIMREILGCWCWRLTERSTCAPHQRVANTAQSCIATTHPHPTSCPTCVHVGTCACSRVHVPGSIISALGPIFPLYCSHLMGRGPDKRYPHLPILCLQVTGTIPSPSHSLSTGNRDYLVTLTISRISQHI